MIQLIPDIRISITSQCNLIHVLLSLLFDHICNLLPQYMAGHRFIHLYLAVSVFSQCMWHKTDLTTISGDLSFDITMSSCITYIRRLQLLDKLPVAVIGLPRLLDIGQCNDVYSAIRIATTLADAFNTDVNGLPLSLIISWYEQKAVADLLALLSLGIRNIYLGPELPAFLSPNVLQYLVDTFHLRKITNPEDDIKTCLKQNVQA